MNYLLILLNGMTIFAPTTGTTVEAVLASYGVTNPATWAEFNYDAFDPASYNYPPAWSIVNNLPDPNTAAFDLAEAKLFANELVKGQSARTQQELLDGYTAEQIAAQAAVAAISRDVRFQTIINDLNVETDDTLQRQVDIAAATTIAEVNAIVYP
jgi:hypothetical protein